MTGLIFSIGDISGLQAGQSNTFTLCLQNHAVVAHAEWDLALSWTSNHGLPWKTSSWWQYISLYNPNICLHVNGTFAHMPVIHAVCSAAPPYHDRRLILHLSLMKVWMVSLVFGIKNSKSIFPETDVDSSDHSTHFQRLFDYLRCALAQGTQQYHCIELMYSFLLK